MQIQYGQDQLRILRVERVDMRPVYDPSGTDYLYGAITLEVSFSWHPWATATNTKNAAAQPFDQLYDSIYYLRERLSTPRQVLQVMVGGQRVFSSPDYDLTKQGQRLPCDVAGGPFPQLLALTGVEGDYGAMGLWRVTFHKRLASQPDAILLSNRWSPRVILNDAGFATRIVTGFAQMRADYVNYFPANVAQGLQGAAQNIPWNANIDAFRNFLFCPVPAAFVRERVDVTVTERGDKAKYVVVDLEDPNPMGWRAYEKAGQGGGANVNAVAFDGGVTVSSSVKIKSAHQAIGSVTGINILKPGTVLNPLLQSTITDTMATAWAQVWGVKDTPKLRLLDRAFQICLDRMNVGGAFQSWFTSVMGVTASYGIGKSERQGRWVRVEIVWRPSNAVLVQSPVFADNTVNFGNIRGEVNYANDITPINPPAAGVQAPPTNALGINPTFPGDPPDLVNGPAPVPLKYYNTNLVQGKRNQLDANGQPVLDGGSRGFYMGQLVAAALQAPFDPANRATTPGPPPTPQKETSAVEASRII